jgi:hypothetical protein
LKEAQCGRLDGTAQIKRAAFNGVGKVGDDHFADVAAGGAGRTSRATDRCRAATDLLENDSFLA